MPKTFRAVDLLVRRVVPPDMQDLLNTYSAKEVNNFLLELSKRYPDRYSEVSHKLAQVGLQSSFLQGDSMGWQDTEPVIDREHVFKQMDAEIDDLKKEYRNDKEGFEQARESVWLKYNDLILKTTMNAAGKAHNAMGMAVASGSRGKPQQIQAMLSTPGLYQDHKGRVIPIFVRNSFSDGLRPMELMAGTFGARSSVVSTKRATAQGGDIGKLLGQATSRLLITEKDCGVKNGINYDIDNQVLPGRVLSRDVGGYKAGTVLDRHALSALKKAGVKNVVSRSPLTCKAEGLCSKCVGIMLDSRELPRIGDHVGATAAQSLGEPLTQGALSSKHTAGQAKGKQGYGGLDIVSQFVQSPEEYQHRATVAKIPGRVESITDAPQGGKIVVVQGEQHYVPQGYETMVDVGDDMDEGDQLSEGLMDVRDVVQYKGLGEGRKYYAERLGQIYDDSGLTSHPKNLEIVARGALNTVTMDDYMDGLQALPDDAVEYNKVVSAWTPENELKTAPDNTARNQYLSRDTLHFTAGTKLNRKQLKSIRDAGIEAIHTVAEKPPFTSNMDRLRTASHYNDDWLSSMSSSYLKKQLTEGAVRGATTDVNENLHWAPRIAYGKGFGENIEETGHF